MKLFDDLAARERTDRGSTFAEIICVVAALAVGCVVMWIFIFETIAPVNPKFEETTQND